MSDIDLSAAIEAAARARWERTSLSARKAWDEIPSGFQDRLRGGVSVEDMTAAAPLIEAAVREQISAELLARARPYDIHGFSAVGDAYAAAARIARGQS